MYNIIPRVTGEDNPTSNIITGHINSILFVSRVPENDEISNGADQKIDTGAGKKSKIKRFEEDETEETADQVPATHTSHKTSQSKKRKSKWKEQPNFKSQAEQSSRGMSFKRMEAYGMHSEVKRVKKLRARDNKRQ